MWASDLSGLVGKHSTYTYTNGWQYEVYYKNEGTIDYHARSGIVAGRCVKDQQVYMRQLSKGEGRYQVSWTEPTGTCVSKVLDMSNREVHAVIFFPQWVYHEPNKTVCFQNDNLELMQAYREAGPAYPLHCVNVSAHIDIIEDCASNNEQVITKL